MDEKITVIIPVFNGEKYLERTVKSLINQSFGFENIEVIIVDDCSTDDTALIIKDFSEKYPNIKPIFLEKNYGAPGKGRNIAIQNASAEYIMCLDSDDEFASDMCDVMYSTITEEDVDFVMCRYDMYIDGEFVDHNKSFLSEYGERTRVDCLEDNLEIISTCSNMVVWNKIYKKELFLSNNITFLDDKYGEDIVFGYEVYLCANSFISLNNYFGYKYHIHSKSISRLASDKSFEDGIFILNKMYELFKDKNFDHFEVVNEYIVIWTQSALSSDLPDSQKKYYFKQMKPFYKKYNLFYRLINNVSLPFNIVINIFIKLFALSESIAVLITKIYKLIYRHE